ncbi:hypothetical protein BCV70DRAFT_197248 [Testicularia cyperi]|uniref:Uncharacterized protein n=1 Tax=Testicularia cyperi TaxID=1882483 RepID=A0A317XXM0_9BASI|nr:hypothetical protein BCV70DRAFT_197248 [Testicularia cyperi]
MSAIASLQKTRAILLSSSNSETESDAEPSEARSSPGYPDGDNNGGSDARPHSRVCIDIVDTDSSSEGGQDELAPGSDSDDENESVVVAHFSSSESEACQIETVPGRLPYRYRTPPSPTLTRALRGSRKRPSRSPPPLLERSIKMYKSTSSSPSSTSTSTSTSPSASSTTARRLPVSRRTLGDIVVLPQSDTSETDGSTSAFDEATPMRISPTALFGDPAFVDALARRDLMLICGIQDLAMQLYAAADAFEETHVDYLLCVTAKERHEIRQTGLYALAKRILSFNLDRLIDVIEQHNTCKGLLFVAGTRRPR